MDVRDLYESNGVYQAIGPKSQLTRSLVLLYYNYTIIILYYNYILLYFMCYLSASMSVVVENIKKIAAVK